MSWHGLPGDDTCHYSPLTSVAGGWDYHFPLPFDDWLEVYQVGVAAVVVLFPADFLMAAPEVLVFATVAAETVV